MKHKKKNKAIATTLIVLSLLVLTAVFVLGGDAPTIVYPSHNSQHNLTQNTTFLLYITGIDPEEGDITFTIEQKEGDATLSFTQRNINSTTELINITPTNDEVNLTSLYTVYIIAEDDEAPALTDFITIKLNISNINDAPNITDYYPYDLQIETTENQTTAVSFNYTATDPDIRHGDNLTAAWWLNGAVNGTGDEYNYSTGFCDAGNHNITLYVNDKLNATDSVEWNVTVNNTNRAPTYNTSTPIQNVTWSEGSNNTNVFNITDYFYDIDNVECGGSNQDNLTFSFSGNDNITIVIGNESNGAKNVSFFVQDNWFGSEYITFTANDSYDKANSSVINLTVTNINDAPIIWKITNISGHELALYTYQINYSDYDIDSDPNEDTVTFYEDISGSLASFSMDSSTGLINFTPADGDEGAYVVNITVYDSSGVGESSTLNLTIYDNQRPGIIPFQNTTTNENVLFEIVIHGTDNDDDSLTFTSNFTAFTATVLNSTATQFAFTPTQSHVGDNLITFIVTDEHGAYNNSEVFNLSVLDLNFAPVLDNIADQVIRFDRNFSLVITGSDADLDTLYFFTNSSLFNLTVVLNESGVGLAYINFTTTSEQIANHSINITINDSFGLQDSQIFNLEIVPNRDPVLDTIDNQSTITYVRYFLNVSAYDPDGDSLVFTSNFTGFTYTQINNSAAYLYYEFDKTETGNYSISVGVSDDAGLEDNATYILNVSHYNILPEFVSGIANSTYIKGFIDYFMVQGSDSNSDYLTFNSNSTIMNATSMNSTATNFTIHAEWAEAGNLSILINLTDGFEVVTEHVIFTIHENQAPVIASHSPTNYSLGVEENNSIDFNQTPTDADGDTLSYKWQLALINETIKNWCNEYDNTDENTCTANNRSIVCAWASGNSDCLDNHSYFTWHTHVTTMNWTYAPNWTESGNYTARIFVYDAYDGNATQKWNLSVYNLNRVPAFGTKAYNTYADFSQGTATNTVVTSDNKVAIDMTGGAYYSRGTYLSVTVDFVTNTYFNYTTINWSSETTANSDIAARTRTATVSSGAWSSYSSPYNVSGSSITSDEKQYIQYLLELETNNTARGTNITEVIVHYEITDLEINGPTYWIDLDDFFTDHDTDETLNYNVTGAESIQVNINTQTSAVTLTPNAGYTGTETLTFIAKDYCSNATSNPIDVTVEQVSTPTPITITTPSGGGGTSTITKTVEKEVGINISQPVAFELVVPGITTLYDNNSAIVPITLKNTNNFTLTDIELETVSPLAGISMRLDQNKFKTLGPGEELQTMLIIWTNKTYGSYELVITARVNNPPFEDTAKLYINSFARGEANKTQYNTKVDFARDLLEANEECLELNELLDEAKKAIEVEQYEKADLLLQTTIESCRFLITDKEALLEQPWQRTLIDRIKGLLLKYRLLAIVCLGAVIMAAIIITYVIKKTRGSKQVKKKQESEL